MMGEEELIEVVERLQKENEELEESLHLGERRFQALLSKYISLLEDLHYQSKLKGLCGN